MPARKSPRRYYADDLTHTVSERDWGFDDHKPRLKCPIHDGWACWFPYLLDTRDPELFVCKPCYDQLVRRKDWKAWEVGY